MSKSESNAVDVPASATPFEPGEPREDIAVSQLGGTFAERAKARAKQVSKASDAVEDKAVKKASTKRAAKKS
jgi:L-asparaginase/Glu-tRNA(Gln) amidotransferase subunit D